MADMVKEYSDYIKEHVENIKKVWDILKRGHDMEAMTNDSNIYREMHNRLKLHDITKLSESEFEGYRQFFYPFKSEEPNKEELNKAWSHHIHYNDHHWEHWVICSVTTNDNIAVEMPVECIIEMLLDWCAMSLKYKDTPRQFYDKNKSTMLFHENTSKYIESIIDLFTLKTGNLNQEILKKHE